MARNMLKILSVLLLFTWVVCQTKNVAFASDGSVGRTEDPRIVYEDKNTRIVDVWENGVCYRTENNKQDNIIVLYKIVNDQILMTSTFDVDEVESGIYANYQNISTYALPPVGTFVQSDMGYGYLMGDEYHTYAAARYLLDQHNTDLNEDGVYDIVELYPGIRMNPNVLPYKQELFTNAVDEMILLEQDLQNQMTSNNWDRLLIWLGVALGDPNSFDDAWGAIQSIISNLAGEDLAWDLTEQLYDKADSCAEYYEDMHDYRLNQ